MTWPDDGAAITKQDAFPEPSNEGCWSIVEVSKRCIHAEIGFNAGSVAGLSPLPDLVFTASFLYGVLYGTFQRRADEPRVINGGVIPPHHGGR